jgi:hypothetical protein
MYPTTVDTYAEMASDPDRAGFGKYLATFKDGALPD